jgi:SOS-response transcriptional repressor LexA
MIGLTRAEANCLEFIQWFHAREGIMPSRREIAAGLDFRSTAGAARLVDALVEKGRLRRLSSRARALGFVTHIHCPNCNHSFDPSAGRAQ